MKSFTSQPTEPYAPKRQLLEALLVDNEDLNHLESLLAEFNLFEAIGAVRQELHHSCFLAFLLDPHANHGLDDYFLKVLFKRCLAGQVVGQLSAIDIDIADFSDAVVEREHWNIDVLIYSERANMVFALENKVGALEHSDQLNRYREIVDREFPAYKKALVFLSPDGDAPSDPDHWLSLSYSQLTDVIRSIRISKQSTLGPTVLATLQHYETMVGRHIVTDSEIAKLCQRIYRQHRSALDLIFEHRPDLQASLQEFLQDFVQKQPGYSLDHCTKSFIRFFRKDWDDDSRQKSGAGWTYTKRVVLFEVANSPESARLKLIIGPTDKNVRGAVEFRRKVFEHAQQHRVDFPGCSNSLYERWTTILSKELVKKADYTDLESVPEKLKQSITFVFENIIPKAVSSLDSVFRA